MIYRKTIPHWTEKFGESHEVWFFTNHVMQESLDNYRAMEEKELPVPIQEEFQKFGTSAVIQDKQTGNVLKTYTR